MRGRVIGILAGGAWALGLLVVSALYVPLPVFTLTPTVMTAFLAPGLGLAAMVLWQGFRGQPTDTPVIRETVCMLVLALAIWPAAAVLLGPQGPGAIVVLGGGLLIARVLAWLAGPRLQAVAFWASLLPTIFAALWALGRLTF